VAAESMILQEDLDAQPPNAMSGLRATLMRESINWRALGANPGAWLVQEYVGREGIDCQAQALPSRFRPMTPQYCFANASKLMRRKGLRYCEGYVWRTSFPITIHHAWVIDDQNRVIDPTLERPEECEYLGIVFTADDLRTRNGGAALLVTSLGMVNAEFILKRCPALGDLMKSVS
jgi:hypothetical protein